ncbi:MAG: hypothetical protein IPQ07_08850 [Myxococcales bacterium]|nr:hypothetical protein [Myxococcales bacterium]
MRWYLVGLLVGVVGVGGCGRLGFDELPAPPPSEVVIDSFSTTSDTFVDVPGATLELPPSDGQRWLVLVSATLQASTFAEIGAEARYTVDGIEDGIGGVQNSTFDRPGPWQHFTVVDGAITSRQIAVQLREGTGATATIAQLHLVAVALPAATEPLYASADPVLELPPGGYVTAHTFTLTPRTAGDYLVLLLVNVSDRPGESDAFIQWLDPAGAIWFEDLQMPRTPWQSVLVVRRVALPAGPSTITLQAHGGQGIGSLRNARVLAIRTAGLSSFDTAFDDTPRSSAAAQQTVTAELTLPPAATPTSLYLASARLEEACAGAPPAEREVTFTIDGATSGFAHATPNCAYEATYGLVQLVTGRPRHVSLGFGSGNAITVDHRESALVVLGLP